MVELIVALGILLILLSIFIPYAMKLRESERREQCRENLRKIGWALTGYAQGNSGIFPRVRYEHGERAHWHTSFTGADSSDPFADDSAVEPNDVSASLWLLVRCGYIAKDYAQPTAAFICPSAGGQVDAMTDAQGRDVPAEQRGNFRSRRNLSYSYASPFGDAKGYGVHAYLKPDFVVVADQNPGRGGGSDVVGVAPNAEALELAKANSLNHARAGQNVLYGDMHVEWRTTPYCGVNGDNIYSAQAPEPFYDELPEARIPGYIGRNVAPAWEGDSYLLPMESTP